MEILLDHIERYHDITVGRTNLTEGEIKSGWHFCPNWDGLLIGPGMDEMEACGCKK